MDQATGGPDQRHGVDRRAASRTTPDRRRGRPRASVPGSTISAWLPEDVHDRLIQLAEARELSVSAFVRRVIILTLR